MRLWFTGGLAAAATLAAAAPASAAIDFADAVSYTADASASGVEALDADRDGDRDLVAIGNNEVTLHLNNGNGTFATPSAIGGPIQPGNGLAVGRFDGGRKTDIAVVDDRTDPARVAILLSRGDGTFRGPVRYRAGGGPGELAVGDFDGDGELDLAASSGVTERLAVLFGHGDGTFTRARNVDIEDQTFKIAAGDVNGDGRDDVAAVNVGNDVSVAYGRGDRSLRAGDDQDAGSEPFAVEIADLDADGRRDIAVTNSSIPADAEYVAVLWRRGGGFDPFTSHTLGEVGAVQALAIGKLSGDGLPDPVSGNYGGSITGLENAGKRSFAGPATFPVDGDIGTDGVQDVEVARLDANASFDVVTANDNDSSLSVFLNEVP